MRKILRNMAKAQMKKMGVNKVNKRMRGNWRQVVNAYPVDVGTGEQVKKTYYGRKKYRSGSYTGHLLRYNWKFQQVAVPKKRRGLLKRA